MAGSRIGGLKAAATNKQRYGDTFYVVIGAAGGKKSKGGQFMDKEKARFWGRIGGKKTRDA